MSGRRRKKKSKGVKTRVDDQRAEAVRLRAEGLTLAAIGERLGLHYQRVGVLLKPVPPNHCRNCGGEIERVKRYHPQCLPSNHVRSGCRACGGVVPPRKQYHPECRPSRYVPVARPSKEPAGLTGRTFGGWTVLGFAGDGKWLCRCGCGVERPVLERSLRKKTSSRCARCAAKKRWADVWKAKRRRRKAAERLAQRPPSEVEVTATDGQTTNEQAPPLPPA